MLKEVRKPFDWTYTTEYKGTLTGENLLKVGVTYGPYLPSHFI